MNNTLKEIFIKEFIKIATKTYQIKYIDAEKFAYKYYKNNYNDVIQHKNAVLPIYVAQILDNYGVINHDTAIKNIINLARNNKIISN